MKGIDVVDDFVPAGASDGDGEGPAVTIAAGVSTHELYAAVAAKGRVAVGGAYGRTSINTRTWLLAQINAETIRID